MDIRDLLLDLVEELLEKLPKQKVYQRNEYWCYIVDNVVYAPYGPKKDIVGISSEQIGIATLLDGNPDSLIPVEIKLPLMDIFTSLSTLLTPA